MVALEGAVLLAVLTPRPLSDVASWQQGSWLAGRERESHIKLVALSKLVALYLWPIMAPAAKTQHPTADEGIPGVSFACPT